MAVLLIGTDAQVQRQDASICRSLAMDCFMNCLSDSNTSESERCKQICMDPYECGFSRDVWSQVRTDWCCACKGIRCQDD